ncbi:uncharacterized protein Z519_02311 [Cladophialophora bantiana CBS 173.52]|uniref:SET domain-containing protein n=1 Tax=Cladophialophora bantiana (strain ATCC 10958 / CBS 173.52 / CDC B-1940 / NIH 8579) TaxID=1442370 RepID=A0A0D2I166_CLAB1|nr:uncharacterized protein Z519_02311 [Cladophialophora bantiana CBS 173.52]KIW96920.1 hypothetical protein Z519_02311 [Cladophialophora bantiana CBS 173.52]
MKLNVISLGVLCLFVSLVASSEQAAPPSQDESSTTSSEIVVDHEHDDRIKPATSGEKESLSSYFPWTHKPICTEHLDEKDQFCVYTNASFSNGRGISIFTRPGIAQEFASLPPFQDPTALSSKGINLGTDTKDRPWYVASVPGKGMGMFASRPLGRGDLITAYTPYLLAYIDDLAFADDREKLLRHAVDQLPSASRDAYLALAKIYNEPDVVVQDVLKANAFNMKIGGLMHPAVFPEASRINHACAPNAQYFLSTDLLTQYIHAVRPIKKDEEITISYAPPLRLHADRQQYFQSIFQFTCTCQRCSPSSYNKKRTIGDSDRATQDIVTLQWELSQPNSTASVTKAEMLVKLYKAEGLDGFLDSAYGYAALAYNRVGSARGAKKYAKLAVEATWLKYGFDGVGMEKAREWESIARDPTGHASWRGGKTEL